MIAAPTLGAQRLDWRTRAVLYGDNTEFFTPYRTGETILGGQVSTWLEAAPSRKTELHLGVFVDRRWGSGNVVDSVKPILSARYRTRHGLGVLGTLENIRRHGLLDPVMVSTRELTAPIEYGAQWREQRDWLDGDVWVNWRQVNTASKQEEFELGVALEVRPTDGLAFRGQQLWSHRGGQLQHEGAPVANNRVAGLGAAADHRFANGTQVQVAAMHFWSNGHLAIAPTETPAESGHGTLIRLGVAPWRALEVFGLYWTGRNFHAAGGDPNYGSIGVDDGFYRADRRYLEVGALYRQGRTTGPTLDADVRWHRIDDEPSVAFLGTSWEWSFRVVVRMPLDVSIRR